MARANVFDGIDFSVSYHPGKSNYVCHGAMTGLNAFKLHFKGQSAHAGGNAHNGRSALDAIELTNVGINYLREHVPTTVRMHYVITEGGVAPNIVPDKACAWYFVRAMDRETVDEVYKRVLDVAYGAARMTGTELEVEFLGGCYPTLSNHVLAQVIQDSLCEVKPEPWTQDEIEFAAALNGDTNLSEHLHTSVLPLDETPSFGSTDVGHLQHLAPGVMFYIAARNTGSPGHHWQIAACSGHSIGLKGMLHGAKVMAHFGLKVMTNPELLAKAKQEFEEKTKDNPYVCPIPDGIPIPEQNQ